MAVDWVAYVKKNPEALGRMDFETRSEANLKKAGVWNYARHKSTEAMCLSYKLPGYSQPRLWHMAHPQHFIAESLPPQDLFDFLEAGGLIEAHNVFFDRCIWFHVMMARHGWPKVADRQWRCSAAKANASSLPRDLKRATKAMHLEQIKDDAGHKLMLKLCKPRKPRKAERNAWAKEHGKEPMPTLWHEEEDDLVRNWEYCKQDVRAEEALSESIPDLSKDELHIWKVDQRLNWRGLKFDLDLAHAALAMATEWRGRLNRDLFALTGIEGGTKRQQIKAWLETNEDVILPDTTADTLMEYLKDPEISSKAKQIISIIRDVNRTSTNKWQTMIDKADPDDWRIRDLLMYYGAGTGRWAGKGVQIHNFPARDLIVKDFGEAAEDIKAGFLDWIVAMYGDPLQLLSHALRGGIIPGLGKEFLAADYSAIEARCVLWEAEAEDALEVFRRGEDIYCDMATGIYGYPVTKKENPSERQFGKQAILGLGFGMAFATFLLTCRKYDIHFTLEQVIKIMGEERFAKYELRMQKQLEESRDKAEEAAKTRIHKARKQADLIDGIKWVKKEIITDDLNTQITRDANGKIQNNNLYLRLIEAREEPFEIVHELVLMKYTTDVYRARYPEVPIMWKGQEAAAMKAIGFPGPIEHLSYEKQQKFRSDKRYKNAEVKGVPTEFQKIKWYLEGRFLICELPSGRKMRYNEPYTWGVKTIWGEVKKTIHYKRVNALTRNWETTTTYGGKLTENITQAVARDAMAIATCNADAHPIFVPVMTVHDELVVEVNKGEGSVEDFEALMADLPPSFDGCPIDAEAERLTRYKK